MKRYAWWLALVLPGATALAGSPGAFDWPQWQGPERNNVSKETGLMKQWPKTGPKLLWTYKQAGLGYSSPAVVGERMYLMGAWDGKEWLYALNVKNGEKVWATALGKLFVFFAGLGRHVLDRFEFLARHKVHRVEQALDLTA